jgi:hypothetical protein
MGKTVFLKPQIPRKHSFYHPGVCGLVVKNKDIIKIQ